MVAALSSVETPVAGRRRGHPGLDIVGHDLPAVRFPVAPGLTALVRDPPRVTSRDQLVEQVAKPSLESCAVESQWSRGARGASMCVGHVRQLGG